MTSAIIYNDTSISVLVTDSYCDDRMIVHKHVFCLRIFTVLIIYFVNSDIDCVCSILLITVDNINTVWTCVLCITTMTDS